MGLFGGDPLGPSSSTAHAPIPMGVETGTDMFMNFAAANDYMLQQPDAGWYPPATGSSGNVDFTYVDITT